MNSKKRDQVVDTVNRLTQARAEVARLEQELDDLLMPGQAEQEPAKPTRRRHKKSAEETTEVQPSKKTGYGRLVAAVKKKGSGETWTPQELAKAAKVKDGTVYELLKRAQRERVLNKTGFGQYEAAALN